MLRATSRDSESRKLENSISLRLFLQKMQDDLIFPFHEKGGYHPRGATRLLMAPNGEYARRDGA